ncbi:MAG: hypothetical protein V1493_01975 [Candidatus Diapherotrites archaeon]
MKRALFLISFLLFLGSVNAIVIVPPILYIASLSILSVLFNMFVGLFCWIALQGIATKKFFGKPLHSIAGFILPSFGKIFFALLLVAGASFVLHPLEAGEALAASAAAAAIFFACLFLAGFREIRNSEKKAGLIVSIAVFSVFVLALGFASIMLSIETTPVIGGRPEPAFNEMQSQAGMPFAAPAEKPSVSEDIAGAPAMESEAGGKTVVEALWLVPENSGQCTLKAAGKELSFAPEKNCLEKKESGMERAYCPIKILPSDTGFGKMALEAGGSCSGSMNVVAGEKGFEVLEG